MNKLIVLGDIMFQKQMLDCDYDYMFSNVKDYLMEADLVLANLETPVIETITSSDKIKNYQFVAPAAYARALKNVNITIVSTANNHCLDNGKDGIGKTIDILDRIGIEHVGTYKNKNDKRYLIKVISGKKIAIIANTYGTNAFINGAYLDEKDQFHICMLQEQELRDRLIRKIYCGKASIYRLLRKILKKFHLFQFERQAYERVEKSRLDQIKNDINTLRNRENPDYVIMMMHDGGQNNELPIGRTEERIKIIKKMGIDAIIANHEHMIHRIDVSGDDITTFSLGNFMSLSGVLLKPFDKMQDYSIGVNIYFEENVIRYTFTIFKLVFDKKKQCVKVNLLYDLIMKEKDITVRDALINDNGIIVKKVLGKDVLEIKKEYAL